MDDGHRHRVCRPSPVARRHADRVGDRPRRRRITVKTTEPWS